MAATMENMKVPEIAVIAHNIRSTHNVGSIFRSCDGFGVKKIYLTGYTPHPKQKNDSRLPHIADKLSKQIHKTALGAEQSVPFSYSEDIWPAIKALCAEGYCILGLEQDTKSLPLSNYQPKSKTALIVGEEVNGIEQEILDQCDEIVEISMKGQKESFNVSVATGIALYALTI